MFKNVKRYNTASTHLPRVIILKAMTQRSYKYYLKKYKIT